MPQIGSEVRVLYTDPTAIIRDLPEVVYGRLGVQLDADGKASGITVESGGGATFIDTNQIVSVTLA